MKAKSRRLRADWEGSAAIWCASRLPLRVEPREAKQGQGALNLALSSNAGGFARPGSILALRARMSEASKEMRLSWYASGSMAGVTDRALSIGSWGERFPIQRKLVQLLLGNP